MYYDFTEVNKAKLVILNFELIRTDCSKSQYLR